MGTKFTWEDFLIITAGWGNKERVCQEWCDDNGLEHEIPLLSQHRRSEPCAVAVHSLVWGELWQCHCAGFVSWHWVKVLGWAGPAPSGNSVRSSFSSLGMPVVLSCPEGQLSECWTELSLPLAARSFDLQRLPKIVDVWFSFKWEGSANLNPFSSYWILARAPVSSSGTALLHHLFLFPLRYRLLIVCITGLREEGEHDDGKQKVEREMTASWGRGQQQTEEK